MRSIFSDAEGKAAPVEARFCLVSLDETGASLGNIGIFRVKHCLDAYKSKPLVLEIPNRTAHFNNSSQPAKGPKTRQTVPDEHRAIKRKEGHVRYGFTVDDGKHGNPGPAPLKDAILNYSWDVLEDGVSARRDENVPVSVGNEDFGSW